MKIALLIVALIAMTTIGVYSQGKITIKPRDFPSYAYQIFDVREPVTPANGVATVPNAASSTANRSTVRLLPTSGSGGRIQKADREFEIFCDQMGETGYRLVQIVPRTGSFRAVFEREFPPIPKN